MTIFIYNFKRLLKDKGNLIVMLLVPIAFIVLTLLLNTNSTSAFRIGFVDYDKTPLTEAFVGRIRDKVQVVELKEEELQGQLIRSNIEYGLVIPKGFTTEIISMEEASVEGYKIMESDAAIPTIFFIESFINSTKHIAKAANGDNDAFYRGMTAYLEGVNTVQYTTFENTNKSKDITLAGMGFLLMSMLYFSISTATIVLEDKKNKTFYRTLSSPLNIKSYMLQNLLCYLFLQQLQIIMVFSIMSLLFKMNLGPSVVKLFLVIFVFSIVCIAFGTALATLSKTSRQASALSSFIIMPMVMLGGCFWPIEIMPEFLQKLSNLTPTTWALRGVEKILFGGSLSNVSKELLMLLLFGVVFFLLGSWRKKDIIL